MTTTASTAETLKEMKFKDGHTIPAGTKITFTPTDQGIHFYHDGKPLNLPYKIAYKYLPDFEAPPDLDEIEEMVCDGSCTTPRGDDTEPDGHGPDGCPSWLLIFGLI